MDTTLSFQKLIQNHTHPSDLGTTTRWLHLSVGEYYHFQLGHLSVCLSCQDQLHPIVLTTTLGGVFIQMAMKRWQQQQMNPQCCGDPCVISTSADPPSRQGGASSTGQWTCSEQSWKNSRFKQQICLHESFLSQSIWLRRCHVW